ncbi:MAG TPA: hypothetical protein VFH95_15860 [Candidatus Kapabacteria bacterium]|nr:hypothetical protein [Candidatus Kapabacteria bacterium]
MNIGEDKILDFLDGRLATPDEEELLHTLAVSPERRQVLREHMKVRQLTSTLAQQEQFNVPERLTNQLFARLEDMGYSAPSGTEAILTRAPEFVSSRIADGIGAASMASIVGDAGTATVLGAGWRFGAVSLVTVALMSFILGAGAYYVFGSSLGLRTRSEEIAVRHPSVPHLVRHSAPAMQYDLAEAAPVAKNVSQTAANAEVSVESIVPTGQIGPIGRIGESDVKQAADIPKIAQPAPSQSDIAAITYTAPREPVYAIAANVPRYLPNASAIWPEVIPSPLAQDRGTISVRYGIGPAPSGTSEAMSWLNEFRLGWTMGYFVGGASMGQLSSIERSVQSAGNDTKGFIISTPEAAYPVRTTLIGLDAGLTLDPLGIPVQAMVGFMYSGAGDTAEYSSMYYRASLMVHFEPWRELSVSGGIEGLWYTHYLTGSIANQRTFYYHYKSSLSKDAVTQETCGLVGPTLQIGWHF